MYKRGFGKKVHDVVVQSLYVTFNINMVRSIPLKSVFHIIYKMLGKPSGGYDMKNMFEFAKNYYQDEMFNNKGSLDVF